MCCERCDRGARIASRLTLAPRTVIVSGSFLYRVRSIRTYAPWRSRAWCWAVFASLALQVVFFAVFQTTVTTPPGLGFGLSDIPWYCYVVGLAAPPLLLIPSNEWAKHHDRVRLIRFQRRARLLFDTKLGMHSPL